MALTKNTTTVTNIADLSSTPNATEGLTAAQLQAKFDKTGADLKTYINDTLTAELDAILTAVQTQLNGKLGSWVALTIGGDVTGGTVTTTLGGSNVSLLSYKLLRLKFVAQGNSGHRMVSVTSYSSTNNYLLTQYNNVIHNITIASITSGSFALAFTPATGSNLIQLSGIDVMA